MQSTHETWRPIPGWEGYYEASDHGRVRSVDRPVKQRGDKPRPARGKILKATPSGKGYPSVCLSRDGKPQRRTVHQLVMAAFVGPRPDGMEVCHGDGNPLNNRLDNLRYDTRSANSLDMVRHGTAVRGQRHTLTRLTDDQVREIRVKYVPRQYTAQMLATEYGVSRSAVEGLFRSKSPNWAWLD